MLTKDSLIHFISTGLWVESNPRIFFMHRQYIEVQYRLSSLTDDHQSQWLFDSMLIYKGKCAFKLSKSFSFSSKINIWQFYNRITDQIYNELRLYWKWSSRNKDWTWTRVRFGIMLFVTHFICREYWGTIQRNVWSIIHLCVYDLKKTWE